MEAANQLSIFILFRERLLVGCTVIRTVTLPVGIFTLPRRIATLGGGIQLRELYLVLRPAGRAWWGFVG